ncbi:uncharacterized protein [Pocillopora verrucosa]|uniref:uncharacterized protein n=1 Tax=Pocillopora verrucosa TaxID=203993 RepID=UPI003341B762
MISNARRLNHMELKQAEDNKNPRRFVSRGCPQGSALGPLLWNVFQNDLSYCLTANLSMYADDHQIYHAGADQAAVTSQLKDSANLATTWASDTRKLERLQERGLTAVFKDNNSSYEQLLEKADLPTLLNSRLQDLCILMYKVKHKLCPAYISNIFKEPNSNYNLRQADFSIPRYETVTYGKHSIRYLGPRLWTKLPKSIRDVTTLTSFKSKIRQLNITELLDDGCAGCSLCSF